MSTHTHTHTHTQLCCGLRLSPDPEAEVHVGTQAQQQIHPRPYPMCWLAAEASHSDGLSHLGGRAAHTLTLCVPHSSGRGPHGEGLKPRRTLVQVSAYPAHLACREKFSSVSHTKGFQSKGKRACFRRAVRRHSVPPGVHCVPSC